MVNRPPAEIGMALADIDTPALVVDLDAFERNLQQMAARVSGFGVRLRAHSKTHKSPVIAVRQMALGAVGVCCQKVSEAEIMVLGGVTDVLVSNQVVGRQKLKRLAALAKQAKVMVCADDVENIADLDSAAKEAGVTLTVLVEVNVGANRCGVAPGEETLALAKAIDVSKNLHFGGLQAYQGAAQHIRDFNERRDAIDSAVRMTADTIALLEKNGLPCDVVGGAGTGSFEFEGQSGVYNELQCGSYVFMDADYGRNLKEDGGYIDEFAHALYLYATVMSKPGETHAVVDAGLKAFSVDSGMPSLPDFPELAVIGASDEHGKIALTPEFNAGNRNLRVGDKIRMIPGHIDPTVNLHDWYVGVRDGRVETLWPVAARGALW